MSQPLTWSKFLGLNMNMLGNTLAHISQLFLLISYIERLKNKTKIKT